MGQLLANHISIYPDDKTYYSTFNHNGERVRGKVFQPPIIREIHRLEERHEYSYVLANFIHKNFLSEDL